MGSNNNGEFVSIKDGDVNVIDLGDSGFRSRSFHVDASGTKFVVGSTMPEEMQGVTKIVVSTSPGSSSTLVSVTDQGFSGITGDTSGNLFVTSSQKIFKVAKSDGTMTRYAGTGTQANTDVVTDALVATLYSPTGIALDPATGDVFFTCQSRVQMIRFDDQKLVP